MSRDRAFGLDDPGFEQRHVKGLFSTTSRPDPDNGYQGSFPGVKRPERYVDHTSQSSVEVKNEWSCTSNPATGCRHGVNKDNY